MRAQSIDRTIAKGFHVLFNCVLSSSVRIFNAPFDESLCASTSRAVLVMTNEAVLGDNNQERTNKRIASAHPGGVIFEKKKFPSFNHVYHDIGVVVQIHAPAQTITIHTAIQPLLLRYPLQTLTKYQT